MKVYLVGGAVRDQLLGLNVVDRDYVVVGATSEVLLNKGFRAVGKDFPVFLHPKTQEEYALARTERKTAAGYHGFTFFFSPDVSLEEDLARRDLTINAMAQPVDWEGNITGAIIDPFNGRRDVLSGIFRHVSAAFAEDPVRILRVARFATRFTTFTLAQETQQLMQQMVASGEVDALVAERVWQEVARGLMGAQPSRMFIFLRQCHALSRLMPELAALFDVKSTDDQKSEGIRTMEFLDRAAQKQFSLEERFAILTSHFAKGKPAFDGFSQLWTQETRERALVQSFSQRLKVPADCRDLAILFAKEKEWIAQAATLNAKEICDLFMRCQALRQSARFISLLKMSQLIAQMDHVWHEDHFLLKILDKIKQLDEAGVARQYADQPEKIRQAIYQVRIQAVEQILLHLQKS